MHVAKPHSTQHRVMAPILSREIGGQKSSVSLGVCLVNLLQGSSTASEGRRVGR